MPVSFHHGEASVVTVADQLGSFPSRDAWYNHIFRKYYDKCLEPVTEYWMPQWKAPDAEETNDPSGRLMNELI